MSAPEDEEKPTFDSVKSGRDTEAKFKDAATEIERIIKLQQNYYAVLKVTREAEPGVVKKNYYKLSRLVHPDKTDVEGADDAFKVVSLAYTTLSNPVKKNLYDRYTKDVDVNAPPEDTQSYAEWEANQVRNPVQVPQWLLTILKIPVIGLVVALLLLPALLLVLLLALLIAAIVLFAAWCVSLVLCVPCRICCCPDTFVTVDTDEQGDDNAVPGDENAVPGDENV